MRPVVSGTDCFDDIRYSVPVAAYGFGNNSTTVNPCRACVATAITNTASGNL